MIGKAVGEALYDAHPQYFDGFLNNIYDTLAQLDPLLSVYDDMSTEKFMDAFTRGLGFSTDPNTASDDRDLLMIAQWAEVHGYGGDDVLVGWQPQLQDGYRMTLDGGDGN